MKKRTSLILSLCLFGVGIMLVSIHLSRHYTKHHWLCDLRRVDRGTVYDLQRVSRITARHCKEGIASH